MNILSFTDMVKLFFSIFIRQSLVLSFGFTLFLCLLLPFSPFPIFSLFPSSSFFFFPLSPFFFLYFSRRERRFADKTSDMPMETQICRRYPFLSFFLSFLLPLFFFLSSFFLPFSLFFPTGAQFSRRDLRFADGAQICQRERRFADDILPPFFLSYFFLLSFFFHLFPFPFLHFSRRECRFAAVPPE